MRPAKTILAGLMLTVIGSAALAQQALKGTVTQIDRINATIVVQQTQDGTVGAGGGPTEQFKLQGAMLETLHAGDKVSFSASDSGGTKTITKIEKQ
jgi:Cu/Ag efflux protein CusF